MFDNIIQLYIYAKYLIKSYQLAPGKYDNSELGLLQKYLDTDFTANKKQHELTFNEYFYHR